MTLQERIFAGKGDIKADLALAGGKIVNVNTKEILKGDIAVKDGIIVGIGDISDKIGDDTKTIDITGKFASPSLIDGHVHFESGMLTLTNFAMAANQTRHDRTGHRSARDGKCSREAGGRALSRHGWQRSRGIPFCRHIERSRIPDVWGGGRESMAGMTVASTNQGASSARICTACSRMRTCEARCSGTSTGRKRIPMQGASFGIVSREEGIGEFAELVERYVDVPAIRELVGAGTHDDLIAGA